MLDSRTSWARLGLLLLVSSIGGVGMWSVVVTLPAVQAEFGVARAGAALPYTLTMLGFAAGGVVMGRATDRFGIAPVATVAGVMLAAGYALASRADGLLTYALLHGALIGMLGSGALFGPVMADASLWFRRRRGLAVAIAAGGHKHWGGGLAPGGGGGPRRAADAARGRRPRLLRRDVDAAGAYRRLLRRPRLWPGARC